MPLDPKLWTALERCGVQNAHLALLVRFFDTAESGHVAWHVLRGKLEKCEVRVTMSAKPFPVHQVTETLFEPEPR